MLKHKKNEIIEKAEHGTNMYGYIKTLFLFFISLTSILYLPHTASGFESVAIQGFVSQGYLKSTANNFYADTENGTFEFNEIGINFTTQAADKLHLGIQFFARDLGRLDNDKVTISWAYGDYRFKDYLGVRAGIMKLALGLYNEIRDMDILRPNILYPYGVYNESWRDVLASLTGVSLYGSIPVGSFGKLKYIIQDGINSINADSGASDLLEDQVPGTLIGFTANVKKVHVDHFRNGTCFWEAPFSLSGLKIGITGFDVNFEATTDLIHTATGFISEPILDVGVNAFLISIEYTFENLIFASEYTRYTWNLMLAGVPVPEYGSSAYYFSLTYRLTDRLEVYSAYSVYYGNDDDKQGKDVKTSDQKFRGWMKEVVYALRFDINDSWLLKLEAHINDGTAILLDRDQGNPELESSGQLKYPYKKEWILYAVKLSYHF